MRFSSNCQVRVKCVERLTAISRGIPQLRMIDGDRYGQMVDTRMQGGRLRGGQLFAAQTIAKGHCRWRVDRRRHFHQSQQMRGLPGHIQLANVQVGNARIVPRL